MAGTKPLGRQQQHAVGRALLDPLGNGSHQQRVGGAFRKDRQGDNSVGGLSYHQTREAAIGVDGDLELGRWSG